MLYYLATGQDTVSSTDGLDEDCRIVLMDNAPYHKFQFDPDRVKIGSGFNHGSNNIDI